MNETVEPARTVRPQPVSAPAPRDLPRIAWASLEAEAFIVRPRLVTRLLGRSG